MLFRIMLGIGAATSLLTYIGLRSVPIPERIVVEKPILAKFDETWNHAASTAALKAASLAPVRVIPIEPPPKVIPPVIVPEQVKISKPSVRETKAEPRDICQRHGLRKVFTRHGRSWRCR
jgi:hypothetical protein